MSSITHCHCVVNHDTNKTMYDWVLEDFKALSDTILSKHEIDKTFFRVKPDFKGNIYYEKSGRKSFRAHFIAELFTDNRVKYLHMILVLRCPTGVPEELKKLFRNGIAVLDSIRAADKASEAEHSQHFEITESIFCENGEGDLTDNIIMLLRLQQTFETPPANNPPATPNMYEPVESSSNNSGDVDMEDTPVGERKVGNIYPACMLPEVEGPLFTLDKAQLRQHDYRDADSNLIAAHEIYHVLADKLRVLDHGDSEPFVPTVPPMPERCEPRMPAKRPRDDVADSVFDSFGSKASPAKKAKQTKPRK
ncbi:hypothetical protein DFH08DRAFT_1028164 [Mycena albidolilacea]|uniref:Uncharacterized protein n=1 Tax=Mycena albidolilacea TaxID=1033008 RepID=A0AAD6ZIP3_9AGAR|nr:hypothetical protein DFH08DRAFT_1028164 [Mycena albidolilacea]